MFSRSFTTFLLALSFLFKPFCSLRSRSILTLHPYYISRKTFRIVSSNNDKFSFHSFSPTQSKKNFFLRRPIEFWRKRHSFHIIKIAEILKGPGSVDIPCPYDVGCPYVLRCLLSYYKILQKCLSTGRKMNVLIGTKV